MIDEFTNGNKVSSFKVKIKVPQAHLHLLASAVRHSLITRPRIAENCKGKLECKRTEDMDLSENLVVDDDDDDDDDDVVVVVVVIKTER
ncbi:hypothetical protein HZH68_016026 [Vespula germanica]|uniref:Uncharacterized protein n=1 Tax=Vespula germanica TaxID=30212 RepID=A0A834J8V6_VESGE|nr:hypothetical protein HZH68_016026 [Vespula germanica]